MSQLFPDEASPRLGEVRATREARYGFLIFCEFCGNYLTQSGALVFAPPDAAAYCHKQHVCVECWPRVSDSIDACLADERPSEDIAERPTLEQWEQLERACNEAQNIATEAFADRDAALGQAAQLAETARPFAAPYNVPLTHEATVRLRDALATWDSQKETR